MSGSPEISHDGPAQLQQYWPQAAARAQPHTSRTLLVPREQEEGKGAPHAIMKPLHRHCGCHPVA